LGVKYWIERTNAIGLVAIEGRHGSTYDHWDIALEFADWVNPFFKRALIGEMAQRDKQKIWFSTT